MEEDYYSDDDEKVEATVNIYYANKTKNILKSAKFLVKDYIQAIVYLTQKQLNELYKGEPITLNLRANINKPKTNIFEFLTKDRSNLPSIIYLSLDQMTQIFSRYKNSTKKFKITLSEKQLSDTIKEIKKVNKQIDCFFIEFKDKNKKYNILLDEQYNNFIQNLMRYSSKTPMLESRKQKKGKVIKTLLEKTQRVGRYYQTLVNIDIFGIHGFIKKCIQGNTEGNFTLNLYFKLKGSRKNKIFPFVLFLTSTQKKTIKNMAR